VIFSNFSLDVVERAAAIPWVAATAAEQGDAREGPSSGSTWLANLPRVR
jgi:hypothetical protein